VESFLKGMRIRPDPTASDDAIKKSIAALPEFQEWDAAAVEATFAMKAFGADAFDLAAAERLSSAMQRYCVAFRALRASMLQPTSGALVLRSATLSLVS
jgi:hypothetical protein